VSTLLILGSKPEPVLPPAGAFDALACANASGNTAARLGLPRPRYTVMSAILTSGRKPANLLALEALRGLGTDILYLYPRHRPTQTALPGWLLYLKHYRTKAWHVRRTLKALDYRWREFRDPGIEHCLRLMRSLCVEDPTVVGLMTQKQPSTGMLALALGIAEGGFSRYVLAGFSFEITHAYAQNPLIAERGSASRHAATDIAMLQCLSRKLGTIFTTEPIVHERAGVPLLPEAAAVARPQSAAAR